MTRKVLILGGLGNGSVIAEAIQDANRRGYQEWEFCGYLNDRIPVGSFIEGKPVIGKLENIQKMINRDYFIINTIYRIDGQKKRIGIFENLKIPENKLATFVHPTVYHATDVKLSPGTVLMPHVSISSRVEIGKASLIMVGASIGHNTKIGSYCHFAAQSCISSYVKIGTGVHIGLNATIREQVTIGDFAAVGMGSVVLDNIPSNQVWAGNPARFIRNVI